MKLGREDREGGGIEPAKKKMCTDMLTDGCSIPTVSFPISKTLNLWINVSELHKIRADPLYPTKHLTISESQIL